MTAEERQRLMQQQVAIANQRRQQRLVGGGVRAARDSDDSDEDGVGGGLSFSSPKAYNASQGRFTSASRDFAAVARSDPFDSPKHGSGSGSGSGAAASAGWGTAAGSIDGGGDGWTATQTTPSRPQRSGFGLSATERKLRTMGLDAAYEPPSATRGGFSAGAARSPYGQQQQQQQAQPPPPPPQRSPSGAGAGRGRGPVPSPYSATATGGSMRASREAERRDPGAARRDAEASASERDGADSYFVASAATLRGMMGNLKSFLTRPIPRHVGVVQCYIVRTRASFGRRMYPEYRLHLSEGDQFLMMGKKRSQNKTSNYVISMDRNDVDRRGANCLGKLRSNFMGTEFTIYDNGMNPKDMDPDQLARTQAMVREELGLVAYASNVLGTRGPRKMRVCVPAVDEGGERHMWRPVRREEQMSHAFHKRQIDNLVYLINKPPQWNANANAYVLNFHQRVTQASVKNFQLVTPADHDTVVLQFGRTDKDSFNMDFRYPLSPMQAFAICLSSFDYKIACE